MTTTYDAETTCDTIAAGYYDDPDTYTIAEAWISSPLGELDDDITEAYARTDPDKDRDGGGSPGSLFAAVAAGIIGGATLGAVVFGYRPAAPPTVVVPGFGVSTEQLPSESTSTASRSSQAPQTPAAAHAPALKSAPQTTPNPVAAESKTNEEVAAAPAAPPELAPPIVVDFFIPPNIDVVQVRDESDPNNVVIEAPILDPALTKPTTKKADGPYRQVPSSRFNSIAKP